MRNGSTAIKALTQGLHHQLLQIAAEDFQTVAVRQHNHVALALPFTCGVPSGCHQSCRVATYIGEAGGLIHLGSSGQEISDVGADQRTWQKTNGAGDACTPTNPVEHVKAFEPLLFRSLLIQKALSHCDGDSLSRPLAPQRLQTVSRLFHSQMGFRRSA